MITFAWNSDRGEVLTFLVIEKLQLILQEILILNFDHFMLKNGHEAHIYLCSSQKVITLKYIIYYSHRFWQLLSGNIYNVTWQVTEEQKIKFN